MFGKKESVPQKRIDSLIGTGTRVDGNITFSGGLRIDGHVTGNVVTEENQAATLVISEKAAVDGEIRVSHVVINGTVNGPIVASEYVELQPQARVTGDVTYKRLEMHGGAIVEGRLTPQAALGSADVVELKRAGGNNNS